MQRVVPLSGQVHGVYRLFPPELLHTNQEGITKYMIEVFLSMIHSFFKKDKKQHWLKPAFEAAH